MTHNTCVGTVIALWTFCADFAREGDLSEHLDSLPLRLGIPKALEPRIVKMLVDAGWIDENYVVHDWKKHGMRLLTNDRERQAKSRKKKEIETNHVTLRSRSSNVLRTIRTLQTIRTSTHEPILASPEFETAWGDWWIMRSVEKQKPVTPYGAERLVKQLVAGKWGSDITAIVKQSADNGWLGFFPLHSNGQQKNTKGFHLDKSSFPGAFGGNRETKPE